MPSDKPIFFKLEDFEGMFNHSDCKSAQENQQKCIDDAVRRCNRLSQLLLQAMEIMRSALDNISKYGKWGKNPTIWEGAKEEALEALKKCDEILK